MLQNSGESWLDKIKMYYHVQKKRILKVNLITNFSEPINSVFLSVLESDKELLNLTKMTEHTILLNMSDIIQLIQDNHFRKVN